jgi:hypothetical protein
MAASKWPNLSPSTRPVLQVKIGLFLRYNVTLSQLLFETVWLATVQLFLVYSDGVKIR